jgi:hypothetical protein
MRDKGRYFATFVDRSGPEKIAIDRCHRYSGCFSPPDLWAVPLREAARAKAWRSQTEHCAKADLTFGFSIGLALEENPRHLSGRP